MILFLDGHSLDYEMRALCFIFFPGVRIETRTGGPGADAGDYAYTRIENGGSTVFVELYIGGSRESETEPVIKSGGIKKTYELALGRAFYRAASKITGLCPPWGILTGIRPVKLVRDCLESGETPDMIIKAFSDEYYTNEEKTRLCLKTADIEKRIISLSRPDSASLYISIPFCPSRCLYCSFISHDVKKSARLLPQYVELLCAEIEETGRLANELGLRLETVYMGGGTPTVLSARQLEAVLSTVNKSFKTDGLREYTVEAGRPDTITRDKLDAIVSAGANRISINPQTLDDAVLTRIGRGHTAADVYRAYDCALAAQVPSVNMDLIAGLPGDSKDGFKKTLDGVVRMHPGGVTVHTLAMKRSSRLVTSKEAEFDAAGITAAQMLGCADERLSGEGYAPYYLYRQRNTLGSLENVGLCLPGHEGLYNVFIMDETHTILACGAGGVTKLRQPCGSRIERVFNLKYPYEYISRFGEIIDRKKQVRDFYANYSNDYRPCQGSAE